MKLFLAAWWPVAEALIPGLAEAGLHLYLSRGFFRKRRGHHAGRRRQGAFPNPVAADAHHSVALDRAGAGADHVAGSRIAAAVELVRRIWRGLGRSDARSRLSHAAQRAGLDRLDRGRLWRRAR